MADLITHITQSLQDTIRIATTKTVKVPIITEQLVTSEGTIELAENNAKAKAAKEAAKLRAREAKANKKKRK